MIMGTPSGGTERAQESTRSNAVAVYFSGPLRGRSVRIEGATLYLSKDSGSALTPQEAGEPEHAATLIRTAAGYQLIASPGQVIWLAGLAELLRKLEGQTFRRGDLNALREELSRGLVDTGERVRAL